MSSQVSSGFDQIDPQLLQQQSATTDEPSCSQTSLQTSANINPPPFIFQRINRQRHVLYSSDHAQEFLAWWADTLHGRLNMERKKYKIKWTGAKLSPHWKNFDQAANVTTGEAAIRCRLCHKLLNHPQAGNTGTTNMSIHISSVGCRRNRRSGEQIDLTHMFSRVSTKVLEGNELG